MRVKESDAEKMFVNVMGGKKDDPELKLAREELARAGIGTELTKGPLIFKTRGKTKHEGREERLHLVPAALAGRVNLHLSTPGTR